MLNACRAGDAKLAIRLLDEHISHSQKAPSASVRRGKGAHAA